MTFWIFLLSVTALGQTQPTPKAKPITIPFEINMGRIYVDAFVNQRGPFRFMVDTGASGYARVDAKLVKELNLAITGEITNSDGINRVPLLTVTLDSLSIGQITRRDIKEVGSRDFNAVSRVGLPPNSDLHTHWESLRRASSLVRDFKNSTRSFCSSSVRSTAISSHARIGLSFPPCT